MTKISVIVPTRNGGKYLGSCLKTCLAPDDKNIEVIVSDNNSNDHTREIVSEISDSRLKYFNTGKSVSMRQNYEFALGKASGDYLMIIGDDDGLLCNGLQTLRFLIEKYTPDVINWRPIDYRWPRTQPSPEIGTLKFSSRYFFGPVYQRNPSEVLTSLCEARSLQYRDGANLYHGCVARHIVEDLKKKTGDYFQAMEADVYASIANLSIAKSFLWVNNPITIGGVSEKSYGAAAANRQSQTQKEVEVSADWKSLTDVDPIAPEISMKVRVIIAYAYVVLNLVNKRLYDGRLVINHQRWREAILKEAARLSPELRVENEAILRKFFFEVDPKYRPSDITEVKRLDRPASIPVSPVEGKIKKKRVRAISPRHTETVEAVAQWIDNVTGAPHYPSKSTAFASLYHLWKVIETDIKARRTG